MRKPSVFGLEPWKTIGGQVFDHWDLWFLVALVADHGGQWRALRGRLLERVEGHGWDRDDAEAKLSHLADLERRVAGCGVGPSLLVRSERRDKRLVIKARDKLFKQHVERRYKTRAMRETPRQLLHDRAMRGHWSRFPVSPAGFENAFSVVRGPGGHHHAERASFGNARRMERDLARADKSCKGKPAQRLALYRAFLTVHLDLIACSDDSCGVLGDLFQEKLTDYIAIDWQAAGMEPGSYLRDFLEFATWEDYGGIDDLGKFFAGLAPEHAAPAEAALREIITELRLHHIDHQEEEALTHLAALLVAHRSYDRFVAHATEMGSRAWKPIVTMARTAWSARKRDLALEVFAAADQPGFHRDYLRKQCVEITGRPVPAPRRARLLLVLIPKGRAGP